MQISNYINRDSRLEPKSPETASSRLRAVERVKTYIELHLEEWDNDLSLTRLSRESGYSKSHLIEVFKHLTGDTPKQFLKMARMEWAKKLLRTSPKTVTEIALIVGYESFPTFSRTFAEHYGISPSRFRASLKLEEEGKESDRVNEYACPNVGHMTSGQ